MRRSVLKTATVLCGSILFAVMIASCSGKTGNQSSNPTATPSASPHAMSPSATFTPQVKGTIPPEIPERLRRPLTDAEIMKLPPATRDMILRAQGKPIPSPSPSPKLSPSPSPKKRAI